MEHSDRLPRKLAAILYADVAGYSRLTGDDEDATHLILAIGHAPLVPPKNKRVPFPRKIARRRPLLQSSR
jgi:hypothetical protein